MKRKIPKGRGRRARRPLWLMAPALLGFGLFYLAPFGVSVYYSLLENMFSRRFAGLENYAHILQDEYYLLALGNTAVFTCVAVPLGVALGFLLAALLQGARGTMARLRGVFLLPMLLPSAAVVLSIGVVFAQDGVIWRLLGYGAMDMRWALYVFYIWKNAGLFMMLFMAGFAGIDPQLYEAAALDGCSRFRQHLAITLPLSIPTVIFVTVLAIVNALKIFKEAYLLYGAYPSREIYMVQHYMNHQFETLHYQNLTSAAIVFALGVYVLVALGMFLAKRLTKED